MSEPMKLMAKTPEVLVDVVRVPAPDPRELLRAVARLAIVHAKAERERKARRSSA